MQKQHYFIFLVLFTLVFAACTEEINLPNLTEESQLVVNSIICPDSIIRVSLYKTQDIKDSTSSRISNARVELYENGTPLGLLGETGKGVYSLNYHPKINAKYRINVSNTLFNDVSSQEKIPDSVQVSDPYYIFPSGYDEEEENDIATGYITIKDPIEQENYYELTFFYLKRFFSEVSIHSMYNITSHDPVVQAEGILDYNPTTLYFADKLFNGTDYKLSFDFSGLTASTTNGVYTTDDINVFVILRSTSKNYYDYRKSWTKHLYNQGMHQFMSIHEISKYMFSGEPVRMFSNVNRGLGVFVGYSAVTKELIRKQ